MHGCCEFVANFLDNFKMFEFQRHKQKLSSLGIFLRNLIYFRLFVRVRLFNDGMCCVIYSLIMYKKGEFSKFTRNSGFFSCSI